MLSYDVWEALMGIAALITAFTYITWREYRHELERRELYSRLMARDLAEFTALCGQKQEPPMGRSFIRLPDERREDEE